MSESEEQRSRRERLEASQGFNHVVSSGQVWEMCNGELVRIVDADDGVGVAVEYANGKRAEMAMHEARNFLRRYSVRLVDEPEKVRRVG